MNAFLLEPTETRLPGCQRCSQKYDQVPREKDRVGYSANASSGIISSAPRCGYAVRWLKSTLYEISRGAQPKSSQSIRQTFLLAQIRMSSFLIQTNCTRRHPRAFFGGLGANVGETTLERKFHGEEIAPEPRNETPDF